MKLKLNALAISIFSLVVLASCGPSGDKDKSSEYDKAKDSLKDEIADISYNIPPPSQVPGLLMQTGAEYNQSLINDRRRALEYGSQMDKAALNLGVYAADIGYLVSYDKTQESIDYMNACKRLSDNLGVTGSFDPSFVKRFERNIGKKDSLAALLDEAIKKTGGYLNTNKQGKLVVLLITGSFVESLYISTGLIKSYPKDAFKDPKQKIQVLVPLMKIVLKQKVTVGEVITMMKRTDQTEQIQTLLADLKELEDSYIALDMDAKIRNSDPSMTFDDQTLAGITTLVEKLRSNIVK